MTLHGPTDPLPSTRVVGNPSFEVVELGLFLGLPLGVGQVVEFPYSTLCDALGFGLACAFFSR